MYGKILSIFLILIVIGVSGCTINPEAQSTFGEKQPLSPDYLSIINSTGEHYVKNGINYYYVYGYIGNNADNDVLNVGIHASTFDKDGNLVATNNSAYLKPKAIPTKGESYYIIRFDDPELKIVRYELKPVIY